jgi:hypothetical protein
MENAGLESTEENSQRKSLLLPVSQLNVPLIRTFRVPGMLRSTILAVSWPRQTGDRKEITGVPLQGKTETHPLLLFNWNI